MAPFDPYHIWLGISETARPVSKYRLLGIDDFEDNRDVISAAAERQTVYLRTLQAGEHAVLVADLLNEISQARVTLLNVDEKAGYDEELRRQQTPESVPEPTLPPIPVVQTPAPTKKPHRKVPKEIWKRPAVIGISVVGVIGVLVLFISQMSSGDADPVASNTPPVVSSPLITSPKPAPATPTANTLPPSLQQGLVAYYPFNGNAQDESGNGHHGEIKNVVLTRDRHGGEEKAFYFAGRGQHISLPPFQYGSRFSVSIWANSFTESDVQHYLSKKPSDALDSVQFYDDPRGDNDGYKAMVFSSDNLGIGRLAQHLPDTPGNWSHLVFTYDGGNTSSALRIYKHGVRADTDDFGQGRSFVSFNDLNVRSEIGSQNKGAESFHGILDDIRIYNRALSAAEVKALYEYESKPPTESVPTDLPVINLPNTTNTFGMTFNKIPGGTFMMGSPEGETDRRDDEQQHTVTITKPFYMQTTEVTQGQWKAVMGTEPWKGKSYVKAGPNYAASYVSWNEAVACCEKLSEEEGKTYRLPTEAEWEYACRAGTKTTWSCGNDEKELGDYAWHSKNAGNIGGRYAHQVGLKKPNAFGLYDMHGNVWEWCHDYYEEDYYQRSPTNDPQGPESGSSRVLRGGSWYRHSRGTRSAHRSWFDVDHLDRDFGGFRLVRELDDSTQSTPPPVPPPAPAIESITNTIGMTLNEIPAGTFMMGSPKGEADRHDDEHQHRVSISKAFYMQTTEVTQGQWKAVMGTEPWKDKSYVKAGPNYAASYVSWDDAVAYCKKLSEKESKTYRLPSEAEWEYACRAGTKTAWSFGNDKKALGDYAWYDKNTANMDEKYAHQVELTKPNAFGLYDMHGNMYEWCHDYYVEDYYKQSREKDPQGPARGSVRVMRGGLWHYNSRDTRSADRAKGAAVNRYHYDGFRLVRELD